jgi:hypothetical protein
MARVAVVGQTVVRTLFQGANPIGETIRIGLLFGTIPDRKASLASPIQSLRAE